MTPDDMAPAKCPRCGRPARFRYTSPEAAARQLPLCWRNCLDPEEAEELAAAPSPSVPDIVPARKRGHDNA
jgi:hypothetical protein